MWNPASLQYDLRELARNGGPQAAVSLDSHYFTAMGGDSLQGGSVGVGLEVEGPVGGFYKLSYHIEGTVTVACDRCLAPMQQPIAVSGFWMAQIGTGAAADDDTLQASADDGMIDLAWPIYEQVVLAVPMRHVHAPGQCDSYMAQRLSSLAVDTLPEADDQPTEPAATWKGIEKLKTIIKD